MHSSGQYFDDLPDEILLNVLSYFTSQELSTSVAPVCKRWWRLSKDDYLRTKLSITIWSKKKLKAACDILQKYRLLKSLKILTFCSLDSVGHCFLFTDLKVLDLSYCKNLTASLFEQIVKNCPRIEILNLKLSNINLDSVCHIVNINNLSSLNVSKCSAINDTCVEMIATNCSNLTFLNIDKVCGITDTTICRLAEQRGSLLLHLFLNGDSLTDISLKALLACKNLQTVGFSNCHNFSNKTLKMLSLLPNLSWLKLNFVNLRARLLDGFFLQTRLEVLDIEYEYLSDRNLKDLASTCKNLKILTLTWCWYLTDEGLKVILDNCKKLKWLSILDNGLLTGDSLLQIPEKLVELQYLNIDNPMDNMYDLMVDLLIRMPTLKIYINGCKYGLYIQDEMPKENGEVVFLINRHLNVSWVKSLHDTSGELESLTSLKSNYNIVL